MEGPLFVIVVGNDRNGDMKFFDDDEKIILAGRWFALCVWTSFRCT